VEAIDRLATRDQCDKDENANGRSKTTRLTAGGTSEVQPAPSSIARDRCAACLCDEFHHATIATVQTLRAIRARFFSPTLIFESSLANLIDEMNTIEG
jgi:hypothetical protein